MSAGRRPRTAARQGAGERTAVALGAAEIPRFGAIASTYGGTLDLTDDHRRPR